ncbi:MAG: HutD family protein [Rubrivivax sp.]|nr:HutD family protein [Rubrivivax sp.]
MQLVHLADITAQPWRNGGGLTRELLRWPPASAAGAPDMADAPGLPGTAAAVHDAWLVRVSVAEITRDGPFSAFPGVERWFAVLQGAGVRLALPEGERLLRPGDAPLHFGGETAPGCTLVDGPTQDLNLMVRGGGPTPLHAPRALLRAARPGSRQRGRLPWRALYAHAAARLQADDELHELPAGTLAWADTQRAEAWKLLEGERAYWMSLDA